LASVIDFCLHPFTRHAVLREDDEQLIVDPDSLVDLFVKLLPTGDVLRCEPATNTLSL
jgi:hypothetical protein